MVRMPAPVGDDGGSKRKRREEMMTMQLTTIPWGQTRENQTAHKYRLCNDKGMEVVLSDFGALILSICLPVNGEKRDVVLGYDTLNEYYSNDAGFGAFVGRNANRIAGAKVTIAGKEYPLEKNDNGNNLHSGANRSYYQFYQAETGMEDTCVWVEFSRVSPHMEQGFPGNLSQKIRYTLTCGNELRIQYHMVSDMDTVINPTNHCYFNLAGQGSGVVTDHTMTVYADSFLPTDDELIPTGKLCQVAGTPFDFRTPKKIGEEIDADYEALTVAGGYDHNFCLNHDGTVKKAAVLESPRGDLTMTTFTDQCGMQVYTGNFLNGCHGKGGAVYGKRSGICFETQFYPNACNEPGFLSSIRPANDPFVSCTVYRFAWK